MFSSHIAMKYKILFLLLVVTFQVKSHTIQNLEEAVFGMLDRMQGPAKYFCHVFHTYAPEQHCREVCFDDRDHELNAFAYIKDQKASRPYDVPQDVCYYSRGRKLTGKPSVDNGPQDNMI